MILLNLVRFFVVADLPTVSELTFGDGNSLPIAISQKLERHETSSTARKTQRINIILEYLPRAGQQKCNVTVSRTCSFESDGISRILDNIAPAAWKISCIWN